MGFFDAVMGRRKVKGPDLDALFAIPSAAITLDVAAGLRSTGSVAVCYRDPEGAPFDRLEADVTAMLQASRPALSRDSHGYTWVVLNGSADDLGALVTDLHAVTTTLQMEGFGPNILCDLVPFKATDGRVVALVYLPKRGTFYPFAPQAGSAQQRDNALELQVRGVISAELPIEPDVSRWFAVWDAPVL
ncbi:MAG: hypothetical protein WCA82_04655 [Jiangellales bacterium]